MPIIGPRTRLSMAASEWLWPRRSSYGLRRVKMRPLLGVAPLKLNPATANAAWMSGSLNRMASACFATFVVYCSEAPAGAWMMVMK